MSDPQSRADEKAAELRRRLDKEYFCVTLELPAVLHERFLKELEAGRLEEETGYEEYLSRLILEGYRARDPSIETPGILRWEVRPLEKKA